MYSFEQFKNTHKNISNIQKFVMNESRSETYQNLCWKNAKIGDIVDESDIYNYAQSLHRNYDDFHEGDLGDRIEKYKRYKLTEIDIDKLDLDEWYKDEDHVEAIEVKIEKTGTYPPIIIDRDFCIIDGTHRANAVNNLGMTTILVWKGIK